MSEKKYTIKYDLATNFDTELIEGVSKIDKKKQIKTVFGKLRKDIVGGGRSSMTLPKLSIKDLESYIDLCHKNNIEFNYLMNPACLGNREMSPRFHKKIVKFLNKLCEIGVDAITVNSPMLCELIKKQFPELTVTTGVAACVTNWKHIKYWEELGADEITLPHGVNRNFEFLEKLLQFTKNRKIGIRLIANNICLHECPYKYNHSTGQSHASQKGSSSSNLYIDYNLLSCNNKKMKNPETLIASEWIRPEDIHHYEELCNKVGNDKFSIKLLDRTKTTDFLLRVVKAYINESFDGNLIDIVCWPSKKDTNVIHKLPVYLQAVLNNYNIKELLEYEKSYNLPDIYINNKKLEGFLDYFIENNECEDNVCGKKENYENNDSGYCYYCLKWSEKAIEYNQDEIDEWINKSDHLLKVIKNSKFFQRFA